MDQATTIDISFSEKGNLLGFVSIGWAKLLATLLLLIIIKFIFKIKIEFKNKQWITLFTYGWPALLLALSNMTIYSDHAMWQAMLHGFKVSNNITLLVLGTFSAFIVAFFEEVIFRAGIMGIIKQNVARFPVLLSVVISSLLFGLVHAVNYADNPFWDTTNQIIYAIGIGSLLATIYYLTQNLWIPVILHTLIDASSFIFNLNSNFTDTKAVTGIDLVSVLVFLVFVAYSYYLLYKSQPSKDKKLVF
ncbi:CPBP family intramembrane metalloprotease [Fructobacillus fructosus]|nr:CPBP family intramembrane metalloprotease [Fructobacillus fructosus]